MIDAIVLDIDGGEMLQRCVESILAQTRRPDRILVFDNGSKTPVSQRLRLGNIEVLRSETNLGFAAGVNSAFSQSAGEMVALINNDVILDPDWMSIVSETLERDRKAGAVQTIIRRDETTIDGAGIDISDGTFRQIGSGSPASARVQEAWGVSATATLYRRAALGSRVFEERFFAYYEDVELSARLHREGWKTVVIPVLKATHHGSRSASHLGRDALRLRTRNRYLVAKMHPGIGRVSSLLWEDIKLLPRGRSSLRGLWEGLTS